MSIKSLYRRNVGGLDRRIRLVLGGLLIAAGLLAAGMWGEPFGILFALVGLVSLLTGIAGRCPLYTAFGFSTARLGVASRRARACQDVKGSHDQPREQAGACG